MHNRTPIPKVNDFKGTLKKLWQYISKYKLSIIIAFTVAILSTIFAILGPKILGNATQELYLGVTRIISNSGGIDFNKIASILLLLLGIYLLSAIFSYIESFIMASLSKKITYSLRQEMSEKIKRLPMKYFDNNQTGETLSVIINDVDNIGMHLDQSAITIVTSIVTIIGIFIMMCTINIPLAIFTALILPVAGAFVGMIVKKSQKFFTNQQEYLGHVNGEVEEMFSGHTILKSFNAEDKMLDKFAIDNEKLYENAWKSQFISGMMHPIMNFVSNLNYVAIAILGAYYVIRGKITVGNIQSFIQYSKNFTQPIGQFAQVLNGVQTCLASAERIFKFLEAEEEIPKECLVKDLKNIKGNVKFDHVEFGYDEDKTIIHDFNLDVKAGSKVAIVGPTGAGKTTIVKLLMRFYSPTKGSIYLDGNNIENIDSLEYHHAFGMVLQDTWLFHGTILENLRYGKPNATEEEVKKAAKTANIDHFIETLPNGYNMILDEDTTNISSGQRQLLTIARAILEDPKVMILDEATSNVDTRTEELIQEAMDKLLKGRTSFIIAHRLSTIRNADYILVMNHGDIIEMGSHDELLKKNGFYAELYNSQFDTID